MKFKYEVYVFTKIEYRNWWKKKTKFFESIEFRNSLYFTL